MQKCVLEKAIALSIGALSVIDNNQTASAREGAQDRGPVRHPDIVHREQRSRPVSRVEPSRYRDRLRECETECHDSGIATIVILKDVALYIRTRHSLQLYDWKPKQRCTEPDEAKSRANRMPLEE